MAAVCAELSFTDGQKRQKQRISVKVENTLSSLIYGIKELNSNASRLLSELVEREKTRGACAQGQGQEEEEEEEDSDEGDKEPQTQPPAKRSKP